VCSPVFCLCQQHLHRFATVVVFMCLLDCVLSVLCCPVPAYMYISYMIDDTYTFMCKLSDVVGCGLPCSSECSYIIDIAMKAMKRRRW
jgi:hypothetical protein